VRLRGTPLSKVRYKRRPTSFRSQSAFRAWLVKHGARALELLVRCFKVEHGSLGLTYRQALDEALCAGWIDGVRHGLDAVSFTVRFTPRKRGSAWSRINVKRARELQAEGRMQKAGAEAFARRERSRYSFESHPVELSAAFARRLRANEGASRFFSGRPTWYRRTASFWVMSAKMQETRERRFGILLACSAAGELVPPLRRAPAGIGRGA
jgi:uncharacterized protein YdeI (YjbR/CyaY-like superfamily)